MYKVFVYGSLLSGMGNNPLLGKSKFLGKAVSPKGFRMIDLGYFPGVVEAPEGNSVMGEVYEVDDATLLRLDRLEGYNYHDPQSGLYDKKEIDTEFGKAIIYIYNNHYGRVGNSVDNGDWRTHYDNKGRR